MANFTELDRYLFGQATHYDIYRKLGAHFAEVKGVKGVKKIKKQIKINMSKCLKVLKSK